VSDSPALTVLDRVRLAPVVHLIPANFATHERPVPFGPYPTPEEWDRYWRDCLADVGIVGVTPLQLGSGHVPTRNLLDPKTSNPALAGRILTHLIESRGEGGLALCQDDEVLVEPRCCVDLNNLGDWRYAAGYRGPEWAITWVGHPYLMMRFEGEMLILSDEEDSPTPQWAVSPDDLLNAVVHAEADLEDFAEMLLPAAVVVGSDAATVRRLLGLPA
jgi:hypothetical protein